MKTKPDECCWNAVEKGLNICPKCGQVLTLYRIVYEATKK